MRHQTDSARISVQFNYERVVTSYTHRFQPIEMKFMCPTYCLHMCILYNTSIISHTHIHTTQQQREFMFLLYEMILFASSLSNISFKLIEKCRQFQNNLFDVVATYRLPSFRSFCCRRLEFMITLHAKKGDKIRDYI